MTSMLDTENCTNSDTLSLTLSLAMEINSKLVLNFSSTWRHNGQDTICTEELQVAWEGQDAGVLHGQCQTRQWGSWLLW